MSTKIQNYLNLHLIQKKQILGCDSDGNSEKWESVWVASVMSV